MDIVGTLLVITPFLLLGWGVVIYNRLVALRNQVKNAWRQIEVQLKRRHDLIPNLVEAVKDYMGYEQETLRQVIEARSRAVKAKGDQVMAEEQALSGALGRLFALMENYPELKANENVRGLMEELTSTENRIAFARQFYNDSVMALNNAVQSFPSNIIASLFRFQEARYFEVPETAFEAPRVDLR